jgi:hypothetical protein
VKIIIKNKEMIQTQLLKLDPPYQIIVCKGEIGIQIATLIVIDETRGENGEYGITTHSHPVVSYADKSNIHRILDKLGGLVKDDGDILTILDGEGVVWDKVECNDVQVVRLTDTEDRRMTCFEFCTLIAPRLEEIAYSGNWGGHRIMDFYSKVEFMGFTILNDTQKNFDVTLYVTKGNYVDEDDKLIINSMDFMYPMPVPIMEPENMLPWFSKIVRQYNLCFGKDLRFHFKSLYEPPYDEYFVDDFDPNHLTPEQQTCNEIADLLRHTDLYSTLK